MADTSTFFSHFIPPCLAIIPCGVWPGDPALLVVAQGSFKSSEKGEMYSAGELQHLVEGPKMGYAASIQLAVHLTNEL